MSPSHVHATRTYFGEFDAEPLVDWLNDPRRPKGDPVGRLLNLSRKLPEPLPDASLKIPTIVARLVRDTKLAVAPVLGEVAAQGWSVNWRLVGSMLPKQSLAFMKLLQLGQQGVLNRVRRCARKECGRFFYARFEHNRFCKTQKPRCQQRAAHSTEEWKLKRREYMKFLRHTKKVLENRAIEIENEKRKGKRR